MSFTQHYSPFFSSYFFFFLDFAQNIHILLISQNNFKKFSHCPLRRTNSKNQIHSWIEVNSAVLESDSMKPLISDSFFICTKVKKIVYEISLIEGKDSVIQDEEAFYCSQSGRITFASTYSQCRALHRLAAWPRNLATVKHDRTS